MDQTSTVLFYLVAAYIIYITAKGELPAYSAIFFG
jgi:hypothetical protein